MGTMRTGQASVRCVWLLSALLAAGCSKGVVKDKDYTAFRSAAPRSILVVPVVNNSVNVDAPDYFLSTVPVPLAERGYYVFPVHLVKRLLEDDGLSDPALIHGADTARLCELFGSDAVLYVSIERWDARYVILNTQVTVEFSYLLKDGKTGDVLWAERKQMVYTPQNSNTGHPLANVIAMAVNAAITKAAPNYMPLARQANAQVFAYPGPGLPAGPYRDEYQKDVAAAKPQ
jgi:hypothetical protein